MDMGEMEIYEVAAAVELAPELLILSGFVLVWAYCQRSMGDHGIPVFH